MGGNVNIGLNITADAQTAAIKNLSKQLKDLRANFFALQEVGRVLTRAGAGLAKFGGGAVKTIAGMVSIAAELENSMVRVSAIVGVGENGLAINVDRLNDRFLQISNTLPLSAEELGKVAENAAQAGISTEEAIERIALVSGQLGAVSKDLDAITASDSLLKLVNAFGTGGESAAEMAAAAEEAADALSRIKNLGPGTAGQLAEITRRAGSQAKQIGITAPQVVAFSAALAATGQKSQAAGSSLAKFFSLMSVKTAQFSKVAGLTEKQFSELVNNKRGLEATRAVLSGLRKIKIRTNGVTEFNEELTRLGLSNIRVRKGINSLVDGGERLEKFLGGAADSAGALSDSFREMTRAIEQQFATLVGSIKNVAIAFGQTLFPFIEIAIQALLAMTSMILAIPGPVKLLIVLLVLLQSVLVIVAGGVLFLVGAGIIAVATFSFMKKGMLDFVRSMDKTNPKLASMTRRVIANTASWIANRRAVRGATLQQLRGFRLTVQASKNSRNSIGRLVKLFAAGFGGKSVVFLALLKIGGLLTLVAAAIVGTLFLLRKEFSSFFQAFTDADTGLFAAIGELFSIVNKALQSVGLGGIFGLLKFTTPLFFILKGVTFWVQVFAAVLRAAAPILKALLAPIIRFGAGLKELGKRIGIVFDFFRGGKGEISSFFSLVEAGIAFVAPAFAFLGKVLAFVFSNLFGALGGVLEGVFRSFEPLLGVVNEVFVEIGKLFSEIGSLFSPIMELFSEFFSLVGFGSGEFDTFGVVVQIIAGIVRLALAPLVFFVKGIVVTVKALVFLFRILAGLLRITFLPLTIAAIIITGIIKKFRGFLGEGGSLLSGFSALLKTFGDNLGDFAVGLLDAILFVPRAILDSFITMFDALKELMVGNTGAAEFIWNEFGKRLVESTKRLLNKLSFGLLFDEFDPKPEFKGRAPSARKPPPALADGGFLVRAHPGEVVAPLERLPAIAANLPAFSGPTAPATSTSTTSQGTPADISLTIPVTLSLDGTILGQAFARVSAERLRSEFGTRGVRLAGIG